MAVDIGTQREGLIHPEAFRSVEPGETSHQGNSERFKIGHSHSDPTTLTLQSMSDEYGTTELLQRAAVDEEEEESYLSTLSPYFSSISLKMRRPSTTSEVSPTESRPESTITVPSRPSLVSSVTSTSLGTDFILEGEGSSSSRRRPSLVSRLSRLRSSMSTIPSTSGSTCQPTAIKPADFRRPVENPEKHFIDSVGMVIPGVCNRLVCTHPLSHFIINWRLCEPVEYTTLLADHGIAYSDYCRLVAALANFVDGLPKKPSKEAVKSNGSRISDDVTEVYGQNQKRDSRDSRSSLESVQQFQDVRANAARLNELLSDISFHWRARGLPVMVCVSSFSLFAPNRITESHIQILHVPLHHDTNLREPAEPCSSFVEASTGLIRTQKFDAPSVSLPRIKSHAGEHAQPQPPSTLHHHLNRRDRTRPWPLWPNAIPSTKRAAVDIHADRYGSDPYFRAWVRANINSRTTCTSYAKYMIEKENDPFINKRMEYVPVSSSKTFLSGLFLRRYKKWHARRDSTSNRDRYEHNRRLECRKTSENGSRLRLIRFSFRNPIYPPYTAEMTELGLTETFYKDMLATIEGFRKEYKRSECVPPFCPLRAIHRRSTEDALAKASEHIRSVNAMRLTRVVWTIQKIPDVYDTYLGRHDAEWEISAWNAEEPLELLLHLEKWGIIEQILDIEEED